MLVIFGIGALFALSESLYSATDPLAAAGVVKFKEKISAPGFMIKDLKGNPVTLEDYRGKVVLLAFWTTWWSWCRKEFPSLVKLYDEFKNSGFVVLAVDIREKKEIVKNYAVKAKLTFPVLLDTSGKVANDYGVRAHPVHYLIDGKGELIGMVQGARDWASAENRNLIRHLVKQN